MRRKMVVLVLLVITVVLGVHLMLLSIYPPNLEGGFWDDLFELTIEPYITILDPNY